MTEEQIAGLVPALRDHLRSYNRFLGREPIIGHIGMYCRGLLSDLPRKSVEPIALAAGAGVRSLQLLLSQHEWDEAGLRDAMQRRIVQEHLPAPGQQRIDAVGVVAWIDETSVAKKGNKTPGVQRQYCGSTGKIDNCLVSVHLSVEYGGFSSIVDSDLYLPQSWIDDPERCREAGIPADLPFRTKSQMALEQVKRAVGNGMRLDWIGFDEGYGGNPSFLLGLEAMGQTFIGEVPKTFHCFSGPPKYQSLQRPYVAKEARNLVAHGKTFAGKSWKSYRVAHKTVADSLWKVKTGRVHISVEGVCHDRAYWLIVAKNTGTGEIKYFISNAPERTSVKRMLEAAFSRWGIEHLFRVAKTEIGLGHYEGRHYRGLLRHLMLCQLTLLLVAEQTTRLRGEKPAVDEGAGGPGAEYGLPSVAAASMS
jgi:SRSO17 transposase